MKRINVQQIALAGVMLGLLTVIKFLDLVMIKTPLGYSWIEFYMPVAVIFVLVLPFQITTIIMIAAPFIWLALGQTFQNSPVSFFLDYSIPILSILLVYLSKYFKKMMFRNIAIFVFIILAFVIKWFSHTISGVVAWDTLWGASASINAPYVFVTLAFTICLIALILPKIHILRDITNRKGLSW